MWWHVLIYAALAAMVLYRLKSRGAEEEINDKPHTEGRLRLSQYLLGFRALSEQVPMVMWVMEGEFVFVKARHGWDHWDLDLESPDVVCVVPRSGIDRVALLRNDAATGMLESVGFEEGLEELLTCPEHGLVLLAIIMKDSMGEHQEPLFLLDTGMMDPGEDEMVLAFVHNMSQEPRPDVFLFDNGLKARN